MSTLQEIESAVMNLSDVDYAAFREWFMERDWQEWDKQIEADSAAGRLDHLAAEALEEKKQGKLKPL